MKSLTKEARKVIDERVQEVMAMPQACYTLFNNRTYYKRLDNRVPYEAYWTILLQKQVAPLATILSLKNRFSLYRNPRQPL